MKPPRIDFVTYRDPKGYVIIHDTPQETAKARASYEAFVRGNFGTSIEAEAQPYPERILGHIVGKGDKGKKGQEIYRNRKMEEVHLNQWPRAFEEFSKVETPNQLLAFVDEHGPLEGYGPYAGLLRQDVLPLLKEARQMREYMQGGKRGGEAKPYSRNLSARLYKDQETGELEISICPTSLIDALWGQLQQAQSSGAVNRICPYCKGPFLAGGDSGRLRSAEFCSPEHRKRFNSLARSNPKLRKLRGRHK